MPKPPISRDVRTRRYTEPFGSKLPALEQNVIKLRGMNLLLALFYAEELKNRAVGLVEGTDKIARPNSPRVFPGVKNAVEKALTALVHDGAITTTEKEEIVSLIDYRNFIGHQVQNLLSDVGGIWAHRHDEYRTAGTARYDGSAVRRLRHFWMRLGDLRGYTIPLDFAARF